MSEDSAETATPSSTPSADRAVVEDFFAQPDDALATLVSIVNGLGEIEIGVTLNVGGSVVSGLLISGRSYFDRVHERMLDGGDQESRPSREALGTLFKHYGDQYREHEQSRRGESAEPDDTRTVYVHLRSALIHAPGANGTLGVDLWRGRLSRVDGWALGNFTVS